MAITVTKPVAAPDNLQAVIQAGGSLDPNKTYYYILIAYDQQYTTCGAVTRTPFFSDISEEGTFTTTSTDLSVHITWNNASGASHYNVLISEISGDYTASGGYGGVVNESIGTITDGVAGLTVTALAPVTSSTPVFHSIQLSNAMHPHVDNNKGLIRCEFSGTGTETLDTLYDDIVAAGFSDYVYYDGYNFALKGWIHANTTDAGTLVVERKRITMLKGGIKNRSEEGGYVFRFGRYMNDLVGGNPTYGCSIDCQGARYTFMGYRKNSILMYDSYISFAQSRQLKQLEPLYEGYFNGGFGSYITQDLTGWSSCIVAASARGNSSDVSDLKFGQGNNYGNVDHIRLKLWNNANMPYSAGAGVFYDCDWNVRIFSIYTFAGRPLNYTNMYDCRFNAATAGDNILNNPDVRFYVNNNFPYTSDNYIQNFYSATFSVLDEQGNPVEGVTVSAVDKDGAPATWIEKDSANDGRATGNEFTTDRLTDADGKCDFYLPAYRIILNPDNTENISNYSYDTQKIDSYPYTITLSKEGFSDYSIQVSELTEPVIAIVTLEKPVYYHQAITGEAGDVNIQGDIEPASVNGAVDINQITGQIEEDIT